ncbi:MAG: enoyl-CoA hydratase/isomerase family protein [Acidimicrobiales bacterium]
MAYDHHLIHTTVDRGVATAVIEAPPMNVMTALLLTELAALCLEVEADVDVQVVVFRSADPDFFIAHFDVEAILAIPVDRPAARAARTSAFHEMCERVRTMPKVTIAEIAGRVGGGGSEFAASCDMRFGALDRAVVNQMEVPLGILPGGTGTLASRIAGYPPGAVARAKQSVLNADQMGLQDGLAEEAYLFQQSIRDPFARKTMRRFLDLGGQTRGPELRIGDLVTEL